MDLLKIGLSNQEKELIRSNPIEYKKQMSMLLSEARKKAKGSKCYYCGKQATSFCDSHYVPQFCLRNIAENGKLYYYNNFLGFELLAEDKGVKAAGTFNIICRQCDSKIFQDYENPENYESGPSSKMLAEIAMKDYLKFIYKRNLENAMYDVMVAKTPMAAFLADAKKETKDLDLVEYETSFNKAKKLSLQETNDGYELFFYEKLPYVAPIAMQSCVGLVADLQQQCVNNIYDLSPDYHPRDIHLTVLPLADSTVVMMFVDSHEERYKQFIQQFSTFTLEEKLGIINYMIFLYTEDYFISPSISENVLKNKELNDVISQSLDSVGFAFSKKCAARKALKKALVAFDLNGWRLIPNLLAPEYKIINGK